MAALLHVPILRGGAPYRSLETMRTPHYRTREPFVEISLANVGLIRRDLQDASDAEEESAGGGVDGLARRPVEGQRENGDREAGQAKWPEIPGMARGSHRSHDHWTQGAGDAACHSSVLLRARS